MPTLPAFRTHDGLALWQRDWPAATPRARLLLVHGLGEHSGRYARLAAELNALGLSVRGYDQRGHGRSEGERGCIPAGTDILPRDACDLFRAYAAEADDTPFLLGHSLGGLVAMRAVTGLGLRPRGLIASSPALATHAGGFQRTIASLLLRIAPALTLDNRLRVDRLSHATSVQRDYLSDPDNHSRISPRLGDFILRSGPAVIADAARLATDTLLLVAGDDRLVDASGARAFARAAPLRHLEFHEYPTLYHELFNEAEPGRSEVLADLSAWLRQRLARDP